MLRGLATLYGVPEAVALDVALGKVARLELARAAVAAEEQARFRAWVAAQ